MANSFETCNLVLRTPYIPHVLCVIFLWNRGHRNEAKDKEKKKKNYVLASESQGPGHGNYQDRRPITSFHSSGQDFDVEGGHGTK